MSYLVDSVNTKRFETLDWKYSLENSGQPLFQADGKMIVCGALIAFSKHTESRGS